MSTIVHGKCIIDEESDQWHAISNAWKKNDEFFAIKFQY